ncbi:HAMP domain-containing methyl-accepting chemotaxis protein [Saccharicrinis fermentans]|uniref:Ribose and galactose chemoreceptor protein n=1 Tax=Saccharicrinis fermentans DSM 9555 = JCM 21142 TaxID=869213 RepID=W7YRC7_9BACT|nr:methyl-accepting chemotaxis protein [Saccharicrinis fermentans]GAF05019.1 ribose and galactose chemoreceptor protein [Saccharicrinis fermentans DSM 9555 = JCM 21142]
MRLQMPNIKFSLNNIKVSKRLIISYSILIVLMLIVGVFGLLAIRSTQEGSVIQGYIENVISDVRVVNEHNIAYRFDRNDYRPDIIREKSLLAIQSLEALRPFVTDSLMARFDSAYVDIASLSEYTEDYFESSMLYDSLVNRGLNLENEMTILYKKASLSFSQRMLFDEALDQIHLELYHQLLHQGIKKDMSLIDDAYNQIVKLVKSSVFPARMQLLVKDFGQTMQTFKTVHEHTGWANWKIERVTFDAVTSMDIISGRFKEYLSHELRQNIFMIVGTIILSLVFAVVIAFLIIRSIHGGLKETIAIAGRIAKGDLALNKLLGNSLRKDEFGQLKEEFVRMLHSLRKNVNSLLQMSSILEDTGNVLYNSAQQMSNNANGQAASVEEIGATLDEMARDINNNAKNANETKQLSNHSMQFIEKMADRNQLIIEKSMEIEGESTKVTGIAIQTNILALNASVEAAVAGSAGRAFGVVANQVKELASTSKQAADRILLLSKEGVEYSQEGGQIVNEVLPNLRQIDVKIDGVAMASNEQRYKSEQMIEALKNLNNLAQVNATQSEELSASSEELKEHAVLLKKQVDFFTL